MEISAGAKRRFAKDTGIPIHVFQEPYFGYLIDLYSSLYASRAKYENFQTLMDRMGDEKLFFAESQRIIDDIVKKILSKPEYEQKFNGKNFDFGSTDIFQKRDIYTSNFHGKALISIDLKQANFQCMQALDDSLFDYAPNFECFILRHTEHTYFVCSKHLRQVIFGNLNPKRQQHLQKRMMSDLLRFLHDRCELGLTLDRAFFMSPDEIIIKYSDDQNYDREEASDYLKKVEQSIHKFNIETGGNLLTRVELFDLFKLDPHDMFIKRSVAPFAHPMNFEIKHAPAYFIPQIIKYLLYQPVCDNDLVFYYENQVCRFMEPLTFNDCEGVRACL